MLMPFGVFRVPAQSIFAKFGDISWPNDGNSVKQNTVETHISHSCDIESCAKWYAQRETKIVLLFLGSMESDSKFIPRRLTEFFFIKTYMSRWGIDTKLTGGIFIHTCALCYAQYKIYIYMHILAELKAHLPVH